MKEECLRAIKAFILAHTQVWSPSSPLKGPEIQEWHSSLDSGLRHWNPQGPDSHQPQMAQQGSSSPGDTTPPRQALQRMR